MAKRQRALTDRKIARRIKQGRGNGQGKSYQPWLTIQDVASRGQASRVLGAKTGRRHELLSLFEKHYFYILDLAKVVSDIREQYPLLPLAATQAIAQELGIRHPADRQTGQDIVMTTDFVITMRSNHGDVDVARALKPSTELVDQRVLEKLEIERVYWLNKHIDWGIVTEREIAKPYRDNASRLHPYVWLNGVVATDADNIEALMRPLLRKRWPLNKAALQSDEQLGHTRGTSLKVALHFLATGRWGMDWTTSLHPSQPLSVRVSSSRLVTQVKRGSTTAKEGGHD